MKLILHIGTEKTGTTTLQHFLSMNRDRLMENGVLVPRSLGTRNHRLLAAIANDDDLVDDFIIRQQLQNKEERLAAKRRWLDSFAEEIKNKSPEKVIITSEHLQSRLRKDEEIERLKSILDTFFDKIAVVVYFREPISTAISALSTSIKYGSVAGDIPFPKNDYFDNLVNHERTVKRWGQIFGYENLRIRLFEPDALTDGDLIADFCASAKLPADDYQRPHVSNPSLDALGLALLRRMNIRFNEQGTGAPTPIDREELIAFFETHFSEGPPHMPARERIEAYERVFEESNTFIQKNYFPERDPLFTPYRPAPGAQLADQGHSLTQVAAAMCAMWIERAKV
jgi:hypothetical protein